LVRNDQYPSGGYIPTEAPDTSYGPYETYGQQDVYTNYAGYDGYSATAFDNGGTTFGEGDPFPGGYDTGAQYDSAHQWATTPWDAGNQAAAPDTSYAYGNGGYENDQTAAAYGTGGYDPTSEWSTAGYAPSSGIPAQPGPTGETSHTTGDWGTTVWSAEQYQPDQHSGDHRNSAQYQTDTEHYGTDQYGAGQYGAGQYDAGQYGSEQFDIAHHHEDGQYDQTQWDASQAETQTWDAVSEAEAEQTALYEVTDTFAADAPYGPGAEDGDPDDGAVLAEPVRTDARRSSPVRRSALLTVAVPSVAVMGMAGIAAASVTGVTPDQSSSSTAQAADELPAVKVATANSKLDTQLASLTEDAGDFADRASRTQERIDLKQRQLEEKKRREAEAARREALRPKFAIPVTQHGLSAYFGQAGMNWMTVHTGIDFPVSYGTPVMAATDGTVRTQWNSAYGNMVILTAPDGTETWYCHLSSAKFRSGSVKAGQVIAFSGNSGNSTGPHLHFEVHPGGGSAVDPLPWLRSHGLDPT
jgi:murein DD-endopeptidase MepM/ murein hydrolase activator NlpD